MFRSYFLISLSFAFLLTFSATDLSAMESREDTSTTPTVKQTKAPVKSQRMPSFTEIRFSEADVSCDESMAIGSEYASEFEKNDVVVGMSGDESGVIENESDSAFPFRKKVVKNYDYVVVGMSIDGSRVIGNVWDSGLSSQKKAFLFTVEKNGKETISHLVEERESEAVSISSDGSVIRVNLREASPPWKWKPYQWSERNGLKPLDNALDTNVEGMSVQGVNANGSVRVGSAICSDFNVRATRWTKGTGTLCLGTFTGGTFSCAYGVSPDGSVIVGTSNIGESPVLKAFQWTEKEGMKPLSAFNDNRQTVAHCASHFGAVIAGYRDTEHGNEAVRWTPRYGMESIEELLRQKDCIPSGWKLFNVEAISIDGTVLVGTGKNPKGERSSWRAVLPK